MSKSKNTYDLFSNEFDRCVETPKTPLQTSPEASDKHLHGDHLLHQDVFTNSSPRLIWNLFVHNIKNWDVSFTKMCQHHTCSLSNRRHFRFKTCGKSSTKQYRKQAKWCLPTHTVLLWLSNPKIIQNQSNLDSKSAKTERGRGAGRQLCSAPSWSPPEPWFRSRRPSKVSCGTQILTIAWKGCTWLGPKWVQDCSKSFPSLFKNRSRFLWNTSEPPEVALKNFQDVALETYPSKVTYQHILAKGSAEWRNPIDTYTVIKIMNCIANELPS